MTFDLALLMIWPHTVIAAVLGWAIGRLLRRWRNRRLVRPPYVAHLTDAELERVLRLWTTEEDAR